jgi:mannonate dehydratase
MKLGLGLYSHMLNRESFRFAKQAGCTHIVAHLVEYFSQGKESARRVTTGGDWGRSQKQKGLWTVEQLRTLKSEINREGLELEAIENFEPSHWYDVLLDGPLRNEQIEGIQTMLRRMGEVGIPIMGYYFSLAGVWGRVSGPFARGGAESVAFNRADGPGETPIPNGEVWNMIYDGEAPTGAIEPISEGEIWKRLSQFLKEVLPVAEESGVKLAAHPDDPPLPTLRGTPRLVYQPRLYQKLLDLVPSPSNTLEFCLGTLQEMTEGDLYEAIARYAGQKKIAYVHFRNVKGKVPDYREVFVDEGDIDMIRALRVLKEHRFEGILIPDHTPQMTCGAPWHAGMAYALGYMRAALQAVDR